MPFTQFDDSNQQSADLPWADAFLADHPKKAFCMWDVTDVIFSPKGATISCDEWRCFIYKSHNLYEAFVAFMKSWHDSKLPAPVVQIRLTKTRPHFQLGYDSDRKAYWGKAVKEGYYQSYAAVADNPLHNNSPFPMPQSPAISELQVPGNVVLLEVDPLPATEPSPPLQNGALKPPKGSK